MVKKKKKVQQEACVVDGKWTDFLRSLPLGEKKTCKFKTPGQILTLKVIASQQSQKPDSDRQYSVRDVDYVEMTAVVEVSKKPDGNA